MKVIEFLSKWKSLEFYTRKFDEKEYDFVIEKWLWEEELLCRYSINDLGDELIKMLNSEIIYIKQEACIPKPDIDMPQIIQGIIITIKEIKDEIY